MSDERKTTDGHSGRGTFEADEIVSAVATTMFVVDEDLVVQHISDETLQVLGYDRDEVVGEMTCAELCRTPLCGGPECTIKNCWQTKQSVVGETVCKTRGGDKVPI